MRAELFFFGLLLQFHVSMNFSIPRMDQHANCLHKVNLMKSNAEWNEIEYERDIPKVILFIYFYLSIYLFLISESSEAVLPWPNRQPIRNPTVPYPNTSH